MVGFIPDVQRVLSKYALTPYIDEYCNTVFPTKLYGNVSSQLVSCTKKNSLGLNDLKAPVTSIDFTKYIPLNNGKCMASGVRETRKRLFDEVPGKTTVHENYRPPVQHM